MRPPEVVVRNLVPFMIRAFLFFLLILNPHFVFASAFLTNNNTESKNFTDPQEMFEDSLRLWESKPGDALLKSFKEKVIGIHHGISKIEKSILKSPTDPTLYYQRALLSFKLLVLQSGLNYCLENKFQNNKPQNFFYAKELRNEDVLRPLYDEILQHPSCGVVESSKALESAYIESSSFLSPLWYDPSQDLLKAIQLKDDYKQAYLLRSDLLIFQEVYGSGNEKDFFDKIIEKFPNDALSYIQRSSYSDQPFYDCKKAQEINPNLFVSYACLAQDTIDADKFCDNSSYCSPQAFPQEKEIYDRGLVAEPALGHSIHYGRFLKEQAEKLQVLNPNYPKIDALLGKTKEDYLRSLASFEESKCEYLQFYNEKKGCEKSYNDCKGGRGCWKEREKCYKDAENNFERCKQQARQAVNDNQSENSISKQINSSADEIKKQIQKDIDTIKDMKKIVEDASQTIKKIEYDQFENIVQNVAAVSKRNGITKEQLLFPQELVAASPLPANDSNNVAQLKINVNDLLVSTAQLGVGAIPVIGNVISMYEFLSGKDLFTGQQLGGLERTITCLGIFVGSGKVWTAVAGGIEQGLAGQAALKIIQDIPEGKKSLDKAVAVFKNSLIKNTEIVLSEAEAKAVIQEPPKVDQKVYRIFGKDIDKNIDEKGSGPFSASWTPVNPNTMPDPRGILGLPNENQGRFVIEGRLKSVEGVVVRPAKKLDGNSGGGVEYLVPNSENNIEVERISGVNKEF